MSFYKLIFKKPESESYLLKDTCFAGVLPNLGTEIEML